MRCGYGLEASDSGGRAVAVVHVPHQAQGLRFRLVAESEKAFQLFAVCWLEESQDAVQPYALACWASSKSDRFVLGDNWLADHGESTSGVSNRLWAGLSAMPSAVK